MKRLNQGLPRCIRAAVVWVLFAAILAIALLADALAPATVTAADPTRKNLTPPEIEVSQDISDTRVYVNDGVTAEFCLSMLSGDSGRGGISASLPDLDQPDLDSSRQTYDSAKATVEIVGGTSSATHFPPGYSPIHKENGSTGTARYLLVESDDGDWDEGVCRTLVLEVTFKRSGRYSIYYRYWLCESGYDSCVREPDSRQVDQQGWDVGEFEVTVRNRRPDVDHESPRASLLLRPGDRQRFEASVEDRDGNLVSCIWTIDGNFQNGLSFGSSDEEDLDFSHEFNHEGNFQVAVTCEDLEGDDDTASWDVSVMEPAEPDPPAENHPPIVTVITPLASARLEAGETLNFEIEIYDSDGDLERCAWEVVGSYTTGESFGPTGAATSTLTFDFDNPGGYQVTATCKDSADASDTASWDVSVMEPAEPDPPAENHPPIVTVITPLASARLEAGETLNFEIEIYDSDGDLERCAWEVVGSYTTGESFGPTGAATSTLTFDFDNPGGYQVTATCKDSADASDTGFVGCFGDGATWQPTPICGQDNAAGFSGPGSGRHPLR